MKINLVAAAQADGPDDGTFTTCYSCGSTSVRDLGLLVAEDLLSVQRVAWCPSESCQVDRECSTGMMVFIEPTDDGGFKRWL
ncbi:hypothetical protein BJF79_13670 [Actinomadura sp. CNU-125]|uniref:hypothetical protein n=1 Tax=Actinomadura sp. CNU-125 TaxID=1904961 RepID=UPI00095DDE8D|nr:hypothetical protein [Actinomadura sp. CNU-125]OLT24386.1 hypothetical protein BJF79_13670 [Actinomadura sp. CNU-125]